MDPIADLYKNLIREEIQNPEVQSAKEAFLKDFPFPAEAAPAGWDWALSAALRFSLAGALALFVLVKTGAFEPQPETVLLPQKVQSAKIHAYQIAHKTPVSKAWDENYNRVKVKKLKSEMGAAVVYNKPFEDVQVTVVWVLPKGL